MSRPSRSVIAFATAVFLVVLIRTAWISDDAEISLRTVLNVTHGYGLTFNIIERVQTFTHPLWLMLITCFYVVVRNVYTATFIASFAVSLAVFWIALQSSRSSLRACLVAGLLLFSHAFVDFSSSGLENPLSCLLLAAVVALYLNEGVDRRRWLTGLWLLASLLYLTRPDDVLLAVPVVLAASWEVRRFRDIVRAAAIGLLPAAAWTIFSLIYYGFPFPNTAYAKLGMGIDKRELWTQGFLYLVDSVDRDPLTLVVVAFGAVLAWSARTRPMRALAAGIVLYLVYVVSIGGDFMSGRFLSSPFYLAVLLIGRSAMAARELWIAAPIALGALAFSSQEAPLASDSRFDAVGIKSNGTVDERAVYLGKQSIVRAGRTTFVEPEYPVNDHVARRPHVMELCGLAGDAGVNWGPQAHVLDSCALADPLLARLPAVWNVNWRIGHFRRIYPKGYPESVESRTNQLDDPQLREFYEKLRIITQSPHLFSLERWRAIVGMNLGRYDYLINRPFYRYSGELARVEDLSWVKPEESAVDASGNHPLTNALAVLCDDRRGRRYMDIAVPSDDEYKLEFIHNNALVSVIEFGPIPEYRRKPGLARYTFDIPVKASTGGFDTILVTFVKGGTVHTVGHLLLDGNPKTEQELLQQVARRDGFGVK